MARAGFTLIEMMVALAVFGLLALGLAQGTRLGLRAWYAETAAVAGHDQLDATDRALRLLIAPMVAGDADQAVIAGEADSLECLTTLPEVVAADSRLAEIRLFLDADRRLILRWRLHRHERLLGSPPAWQEIELLRGVEHVRFSYQQRGGTAWLDNWRDSDAPGLVRIHLGFPSGDPRRWPDITVATLYSATGL